MKPTQRWRSLVELARYMALEQQWVPLRKAAALYRVTPETMHSWVDQRCFSSKRIGTTLWISRDELEAGLCRPPGKDIARHTGL